MPSTTIVPPIHISILVQLAFRNAKVSEKAAPILILIMLFPLLVEPRSSFRVKYDPAYGLQQPACIRDLFLPLRKGTRSAEDIARIAHQIGSASCRERVGQHV